jgi:hypothetical protein
MSINVTEPRKRSVRDVNPIGYDSDDSNANTPEKQYNKRPNLGVRNVTIDSLIGLTVQPKKKFVINTKASIPKESNIVTDSEQRKPGYDSETDTDTLSGERTNSQDSVSSELSNIIQPALIRGTALNAGTSQIRGDESNPIRIYAYERLNLLLKYEYVDRQTYDMIRPSMDDIITVIYDNFFIIDDPFIRDKYISYLYNPLELLCIEMTSIEMTSSGLKSRIEEIIQTRFNPVIQEYFEEIKKYLEDINVVNQIFNLLYNKLNSLIDICLVVNSNPISQRFNYVLLYLSTIPAKLYIRFAELIWEYPDAQEQLMILQNFNDTYKHTTSQTEEGLSYRGFLTPDDFKNYRDDILRINEISDVTFTQLIESYERSRYDYNQKIDDAIASARNYPKIISDDGEISFKMDDGSEENVKFAPKDVITFNKEHKYELDTSEEENSMEESQIGGAIDNGSFDDFLRVLTTIHDIIIKTYTLPGDSTSIESIKDSYIDYADGDFSGKKIVLDFLGMFMGAVIFYIQNPEVNKVTSYFTYERPEGSKKVDHIQEYIGGDVIMAGYSTSELYKEARGGSLSLKPIIDNSDIKKGVELYAFDDIELDKLGKNDIKKMREKTYTELFQLFPSIRPITGVSYNGWIRTEQPSSLSPFINLALTLDGTNLEDVSNQKFVSLTRQKPTKSLQSCFFLVEGSEYELSYNTIAAEIDDMNAGSYGPDIEVMAKTFITLRKELIGLLVEQGEGVLRSDLTEGDIVAMDPNFKMALKNPDIDTFYYNYIYAYVYKNIIKDNIKPLYLPKCMTLLNSIMMTKIRESTASKNPSKDHGWSKLLNQEICRAYDAYTSYTSGIDPSNIQSPIEGGSKDQWDMGQRVRDFNDRHSDLFRSFYYYPQLTESMTSGPPPTLKEGVFYIDYRDGTKSYGFQINDALPDNILGKLTDFTKEYAVDTCFKSCFTSRPTSINGGLDENDNIYENNCVTNKPINTGDMIYKIFAMDECHDTKPGGRTSLAVSEYIIKIADKSFEMIDTDLTCKSILEGAKKVDPKNPGKKKTLSWEAACANIITGGEFENALVANYGDFTKIDKNKLGITPGKASTIRAATETANTYNNAVFFGNENSGNSGTFVDGGTKKTLQNIHLPNICIKIIDTEQKLAPDGLYNAELTVIVSYELRITGGGSPQIIMIVSLIYHKNNVSSSNNTHLFVTHEFVLGKGISCAQIYDDIYNGMRQQRQPSQDPLPAGPTRDNLINLTSGGYDPALAVLVVLKKTLCDWLQNFLKLGVHTKIDSGLGFSIEIKSNVVIQPNQITYSSDKAIFDISGKNLLPPSSGMVIDNITKVLMALERSGEMTVDDIIVNYLCIQGGTGTPFLFVPYSQNTKLFNFKENPVTIPFINSQRQYIFMPYNEGTAEKSGCFVPRFHLFNYMNIFWDKYRSVYSPEHYRYISTLPALMPVSQWKPDLCITGDILDLWISFVLTKITFYPLLTVASGEELAAVKDIINPKTSIINIDQDPFETPELHRRVNLTNTILTMSGGATKINLNNRRKRKISYSNTKRKLKNGISKRKTKRSNQKKLRIKKSSKNHGKNKVISNLTKKKYNK